MVDVEQRPCAPSSSTAAPDFRARGGPAAQRPRRASSSRGARRSSSVDRRVRRPRAATSRTPRAVSWRARSRSRPASAAAPDGADRARAPLGARPCLRTPARCRAPWCRSACLPRSRRRGACDTAARGGRDRSRRVALAHRRHRRPARRSPANSVSGSSTTPLPIAQRTPGCRIPLGIWCSTNERPPMCDGVTGVRAALVAHDPVGTLRDARRRASPCPRRPTGRPRRRACDACDRT